jgi:hypothetical protein
MNERSGPKQTTVSPFRLSDAERSALTDDPRRQLRKLPSSTPDLDRVLLRCDVDPESGCWIFGGATTRDYGVVRIKRRTVYAFHITYDYFIGDRLTSGLWVDHGCDNTRCCNPAHLQLLTPGQNTARGVWANGNPRLTHCRKVHRRNMGYPEC